jgi:cellulose synthase/poly-beta-1,6-N-acetylglucosamine synthase-like glycosyltransferase
MSTWLDALTVIPASIPFVLNVVNARGWPRADAVVAPGPGDPDVSILVPARNEEATIEACVRAALAQTVPPREVLVADDHSADATGAILARLAAELPRLRVIHPPELPAGWVGKPHACHHLGRAASGGLLLFVDADTRLAPDAVARLLALYRRTFAPQVVTAFPRQETPTFAEDLMVPMLPLTFTSWVPLDLVWRFVDPRVLVVNGQVLAFRREAYDRIGGFESVRDAILDDMAICRRAKALDRRVLFVDGQDLATTRMYRSWREVRAGFSKSTFEGLGESWLALGLVVALYLAAFVVPYLRLGAELALGAPSAAAVVGVALNLGTRGLLAARLGHGVRTVLLHPLAVLAFVGIALESAVRTVTGTLAWRGRTYGPHASRAGGA